MYLICEGPERARRAARDLALIGVDAVVGYFDGDALEAWRARGGRLESYAVVDWAAAEAAVRDEGAALVDVRGLGEWKAGHVRGARHVHMGYVRQRAPELPRDRPVLLYCRTGSRSAIAASVLQAHGVPNVRNVAGGIVERSRLGLDIEVG